jgi:uncharacterized membrane protein YesL
MPGLLYVEVEFIAGLREGCNFLKKEFNSSNIIGNSIAAGGCFLFVTAFRL